MKSILTFLIFTIPFFYSSQHLINYRSLNHFSDSAVNSYLSNKGLDTTAFVTNEVESYAIEYNTIDGVGNPTVASGAVYIPIKPNCYNAPILIYDHGTQFDLQSCPSNGAYSSKGIRFGGTGYITVMPDYIGFGVNNQIQAYHHSETEATSGLDLTRAVREFLLIYGEIQDNKEVYITGYSQGGHSAMATNKYIQENNLFHEFNVIAAAPLSGAYDLSRTQRDFVFKTPFYAAPIFLPNILIGYQSVYSNLFSDYANVFDSPYDSIYEVNTNNRTTSGIFWFLNTPSNTYDFMQDSVVQNMLSDTFSISHPVNIALNNNNVYDWAPQNPIRILYCSSDNIVSADNSLFTLDTMRSLGAIDIEAINVSSTHSHGSCGTPTLNYTSLWFDSIKSSTCNKGHFSNLSFCVNDSVIYDGVYYSKDTLISDTLLTTNSEDSIVSIYIYASTYNSAKIISSSLDDTLCTLDSVFLSRKNFQNTHSWSNGLSDSVYFTPINNQKYFLNEIDINGCSKSDSIHFVIVEYPTLTINSSVDTICSGESIILTDNHNGSLGYWNDNYSSNQSYQLVSNSSLIYTSYNSNNCFTKDTLMIIVKPNPSISLAPIDTSLCIGDSILLNATGANTFSWNNNIVNNSYYAPVSNLNYQVIGSNLFNCSDTISFNVIVRELPNVTANATETEVCEGNFTIAFGDGAQIYEWNDTSVIDNSYFSPSQSRFYKVVGTDSNGCMSNDSIFINVRQLPDLLSIQRDTVICENESLYFSTAENSDLLYTWDYNINNNSFYTPLNSGYIKVTASDSINCQSIDSIYITVNNLPIITANASNDMVCENDSIYLWASTNNSNIEWNNNIINNQFYYPHISFYAVVTTTDQNQCVNSDSIFISLSPSPNPIIINNSGVLSTTAFDNYQWFLNGNSINNAINQSFSPNYSGNYSVSVSLNNCNATSSSFYYNLSSINGIENNGISIHPNPCSDYIKILGLNKTSTSVILINNLGSIVLKDEVYNNQILINHLPAGVYTLIIENDNQYTTHKITKN